MAYIVSLSSAIASAAPSIYVDTQNDHVGGPDPTRDLWSTSIDSDSTNLYIQIVLNPLAHLSKFEDPYNYAVAITTGSGGDTSANPNSHGNPYGEAISFNQSLGGMTDWIGVFPLNNNGQTIVGFNTYTFGGAIPSWTKTQGMNNAAEAIAAGNSATSQQGYSGVSVLSVVVPLTDLPNLSFAPTSSFSFDVFSTGYVSNLNTAYDSLVDPLPTQAGAFNNNAQFDENTTTAPNGLYVYTVPAPEPSLIGASLLVIAPFPGRRRVRRRPRLF